MDAHVTCKPHFAKTKQHCLQIPLPWKERAYAINCDEMRRGRPVLCIVWWFEWGAFFMRAGWMHWWDE